MACWICVVPLLIGVPLIATYLPESLNFLVAKGRTREACALAERYDVELPGPAAERPAAGDRWSAVVALFRGGLWRTTLLFWLASFCGLLLVYGVSNWLPTMMRGAGYELGSSLSFVIVINLGGIAGMLIAGRFSDHFGGARVATVWFAATALGVHLLGIHMTLPLTYVVVFLTGLFLFSAQAMIYATVAGRSGDDNRATAVGWVSSIAASAPCSDRGSAVSSSRPSPRAGASRRSPSPRCSPRSSSPSPACAAPSRPRGATPPSS